MSLQLAPTENQITGKVLVLGDRITAEKIENDLRLEGFIIYPFHNVEDVLPDLGDPFFLEKLRVLLKDLKKKIDFIHPGISLWAEQSEFNAMCQEYGVTVLAPSSRCIHLFTNKLNFLAHAHDLKIPHLVLSFDPLSTVSELKHFIKNNVYKKGGNLPVVLKSIHSSGLQIGIFVVLDEKNLDFDVPLWIENIRKLTGEDIFLVECYLEGAKHITVPFVQLSPEKVEIFPMIDTTLQWKNHKIIESAPVQNISEKAVELIHEYTYKLLGSISYIGVGALEFMVEGDRVFIVGGIPRLNSSFYLWEKITGTLAVTWQCAALGWCKPPQVKKMKGVFVSFRVYAENSYYQIPCPGFIVESGLKKNWSQGDCEAELVYSLRQGMEVDFRSEGLVASVISKAPEYVQAVECLKDVLKDLWYVGEIQTNEKFIKQLLSHPWVKKGIVHASFIEEEFIPDLYLDEPVKKLCAGLVKSVLNEFEGWFRVNEKLVVPDLPLKFITGPEKKESHGKTFWSGWIQWNKSKLRFSIVPLLNSRYQVRIGSLFQMVRVGMKQHKTPTKIPVYSLVHGKVNSILFRKGSKIKKGEALFLIESLNSVVPHALPIDVKFLESLVESQDIVYIGQILGYVQKEKQEGKI